MIRKVSFRNFKAYRSLDLELEPFTVLVGPNASGKTTLLQGLELLSQLAARTGGNPSRDFVLGEPSGMRSFGIGNPPELSVSGKWMGKAGSFRAIGATTPTTTPAALVSSPGAQVEFAEGFNVSGTWREAAFPSHGLGSVPSFDEYVAALSSTAVLQFEARRLAEASYSDEAVPTIHSDGSGLASVLAHLKLGWDDVFAGIELALKQIVPSVRRIRLERAEVSQTAIRTIALDEQRHQVAETRTLWGHRIVLDMRGAKGVAAESAGEGTLMTLGLLTVLMGPSRPKLVLLDDIEMSLHPAAQGQLIEVLRKIQEQHPGLQIIATSHSPFVLNFLKPEEVRITSLAENGFARCMPMTSHPDFERWKGLMSPGEFWSTVGESWVHNSEARAGQGEPATHE
jgi:predicted ATPase